MLENKSCTFCGSPEKLIVDSNYITADLIPGLRLFDESSLKRYKNFERKELVVCDACIRKEIIVDRKRKIQFLVLVAVLTIALFFLGFLFPFAWNGMLLVLIVGGLYGISNVTKKFDPNKMDDVLRLFNKRLALNLEKKEPLVKFWTTERFETLSQIYPVDLKN